MRASPDEVWNDLAAISSHVDWMADASEIRFLTDRTEGVGTRFECDTNVGPFHLVDVMEIYRWEPPRRMGVRHRGLVRGTGEFRLEPTRRGRTRVVWDERLRFPLWLGGPVGGFAARPVLKAIWRGNLRRLRRRF